MGRIRAIIFDLDNTLWDVQPVIVRAEHAMHDFLARHYPRVTERHDLHMITRQGLRVYRDALDQRVDPRGRPYYWIGGEAPTGIDEEGTDVGALLQGHVSITPLQLDLTHYKAMDVLRTWKWG